MTTPPEPCTSTSIAQRIRDKEAQVAALQQEIQQLYRQAGGEQDGAPPLTGITIVDLSWAVFGPLSTQILSDMGAEVIKVERLSGDLSRTSQSFYSTNRNKQSIALDLQTPEGRDIVLKLAERADIFVQNFRPGVIERHGDALNAAVTLLLRERPRDEWLALFTQAKILAGPVYTHAELFVDPQFQHYDMVQELPDHAGKPMKLIGLPVHLTRTPGRIRSTPPALGQHTDTILQRLGYSADEVQRRHEKRVVL